MTQKRLTKHSVSSPAIDSSRDADSYASIGPPLDQRDVAARAYARWVERGCPQGSAEEDWFEAEWELRLRAISGIEYKTTRG